MQTNSSILTIHLTDVLSQQNPNLSLWQDWIHSLRAYIIIQKLPPIHVSINNGLIEINLSHLPSNQAFQLYLSPAPNSPYGQQAVIIVTKNGQPAFNPVGIEVADWQDKPMLELILLPPAIVIDCRAKAQNPGLSSEQLAYLQANGNNASIFIHGFNVPVGAYGKFSGPLQDTFGYSLYREPAALVSTPVLPELNGTGAYNWFVCMEHNLNVAAGFDGKDYSQYTRIVGIIWDGNPPSILDYIVAVKEAGVAANHLITVLKQLLQHNITVNLMAHSLGNQVLLNSLEHLGQQADYQKAIDHVIMWEAAIPDNSFSSPAVNEDFSKDYRFPNAYKSFKKGMVFFSKHDNVLGPMDKTDPDLWQKMDDPSGGIAVAGIAEIINWFDTFNIADHIKSVYNIANMFGTPFTELLKNPNYREKFYTRWITLHPANQHDVAFPSSLEQQIAHLEQVCPNPFNALTLLFDAYDKGLLRGIIQSEFDLVKLKVEQWFGLPEKWLDTLVHRAYKSPIVRDKVGNDMAALIITVMVSKGAEPRPALGYTGPLLTDPTTANMLKTGQLFVVDQTAYYFTHSALRLPSPDIMNLSYKGQLMGQGPQGLTCFGRYKNIRHSGTA